MKTNIYFVRHAEPNYNNQDDQKRELTTKGIEDRLKVTKFLEQCDIDHLLSSPYKRTVDTISDFGAKHKLPIIIYNDLRERKVSDNWINNFSHYSRLQWQDFDYRLEDGESLKQTQNRNIDVIKLILEGYQGTNIAIATHGTALCTILNYYDNSIDYQFFRHIKDIFPFVVKCSFINNQIVDIKFINIV